MSGGYRLAQANESWASALPGHGSSSPDQVTGWASLTVVLVVVSAFGPYVLGPIRLEQLVVYGAAAAWLVLKPGRWSRTPAWLAVIALWAIFVISALMTSLWGAPLPPGTEPRGFLAGLDNYVLPAAVLLLVSSLRQALPLERLLQTFFRALLAMLSVNTLAQLAQMVLGIQFHRFWSSQEGLSVAVLAEGNSRFSGVFNQPAEAGFAYGLALTGLTLLPLFHRREVVLFLPLLLLGGTLSGSKVFLAALGFVVVALALVSGTAAHIARRPTFAILGVGAVGVLISAPGVLEATAARITSASGLLAALTAGRLGSGGTNADALRIVLDGPWLAGFGIGGIAPIPYDSTLVEVAVTAGMLGVGIMALIWLVSGRSLLLAPAPWRPFSVTFAAFVAAASLGFSPLTANRVSSLAWVVIAAFLLQPRAEEARPGERLRVWSPPLPAGPSSRWQPINSLASQSVANSVSGRLGVIGPIKRPWTPKAEATP